LTDWSTTTTSNSLNHLKSGLSILTLKSPVSTTTAGSDFYVVANINNPGSSQSYGIVINEQNGPYGGQYITLKYSTSGFKLCLDYVNYPTAESCAQAVSTQSSLLILRFYVSGGINYYQGYIGTSPLPLYSLPASWGGGALGLLATANENFDNFYVRTPTTVSFTFGTCSMTNAQIQTLIASQLGISPGLIVGIQQQIGCTKKRENQVIELGTVTATIIGTPESYSWDLAQQLISNPNPLMSNILIQPDTIYGSVPEAMTIAPPVVPMEALSVGAIAGIAAGAVAVAGAVGVGVYFAMKKGSVQPTVEPPNEDKGNENIHIPIPKVKKGVDVFNLDPNNHQSITVRNPNPILN